MSAHRRLAVRVLPLMMLAAVAACARVGGPAPVVGQGALTPRPQKAAPPPPVESNAGDIVVQSGDTLYGISRRTNAPLRALIDANNLRPPYILRTGQHLTVPHVRAYQVQPGDTLSSVARRYGLGNTELVRANALSPPYSLHTGQVLVLPPAPGASGTMVADRGVPTYAPPREAGPSLAAVPRGGIETSALPPPAVTSAPAVPITGGPSAPAPVSATAPALTPAAVAPAPSGLPPTASLGPPPSALPPPAPAQPEPLPVAPAEPPVAQPASLTTPEPAPRAASAEAEPIREGRFLWPVRGTIISGFGGKPGGLQNDGINIAAPKGTAIRAADAGDVVYAGNELRGFGNLLLIRHKDGWVTTYAHAEELLVHRGERVRRGQVVARVGSTGSVSAPQLHFEVRKGSRPLNPQDYLGPQTASATP
jgi:murein DD-endopeptidase MepM/ murein hydrolase activator NlpD